MNHSHTNKNIFSTSTTSLFWMSISHSALICVNPLT
jgi:hypothetical protein